MRGGFTCSCCGTLNDLGDKPVRVGKLTLCVKCARNGIVLSRTERKTLKELVQSQIRTMTEDVLKDSGYSKREKVSQRGGFLR